MADTDLISQALSRGYTLSEITDTLATDVGLDVEAIRERGYSDDEILSRLGYAVPKVEKPGLVDSIKNAVGWKKGLNYKRPEGVTENTFTAGVAEEPAVKRTGSVMDGYQEDDPKTLIEARGAPVTAQTAENIRRIYEANPDKRSSLTGRNDWVGGVAKAVEQGYDAQDQALPEKSVANKIDRRFEKRRERLIAEEGAGPDAATNMARQGALAGALPGDDVTGRLSEVANAPRPEDFESPEAYDAAMRGEAGYGDILVAGAKRSVATLGQGYMGVAKFAGDVLGVDGLSEFAKEAANRYRGDFDKAGAEIVGRIPKDSFKELVLNTAPSAIQQIPTIAGAAIATAMAANPAGVAGLISAAVLTPMFIQTFGQSYMDGDKSGLSIGQNTTYSLGKALAEVIPEKISLGALFKVLGSTKSGVFNFIKSVAEQQATEHTTEQITTLTQFALDKIYTQPNLSIKDLQKQMVDTFKSTALQAPVLALTGVAAHGATQYAQSRNTDLTTGTEFAVPASQVAVDLLNPDRAQMAMVGQPQGLIQQAQVLSAIGSRPDTTSDFVTSQVSVDDAIAATNAVVEAPVTTEMLPALEEAAPIDQNDLLQRLESATVMPAPPVEANTPAIELSAPAPATIRGQPVSSYTDDQLRDIIANVTIPATSRRGAAAELAARQQTGGNDATNVDATGNTGAGIDGAGSAGNPSDLSGVDNRGGANATAPVPGPGTGASVGIAGLANDAVTLDQELLALERQADFVPQNTQGDATNAPQSETVAQEAPQATATQAGTQQAAAPAGQVTPGTAQAAKVTPQEQQYQAEIDRQTVKLDAINARRAPLVTQYNALVEQYKVADEPQRTTLRPVMDNLNAQIDATGREAIPVRSAIFKAQQKLSEIKTKTENQQKYGAMPVGTKIGVIGHEFSDKIYWEKTGDNQWTRVGIGSQKPTVTNADMEGDRVIGAQPGQGLPPTAIPNENVRIGGLNNGLQDGTQGAPTRSPERLALGQHHATVLSRAVGSGASVITPVPMRDASVESQRAAGLRGPAGIATGRLLGAISGRELVVFEANPGTDGFVIDGDNRYVYLRADADTNPLTTAIHEVTHAMERDVPEAYRSFEGAVSNVVDLSDDALLRFAQAYDFRHFRKQIIQRRLDDGESAGEILDDLLASHDGLTRLGGRKALRSEFHADLMGRATEHEDTWRMVTEEMARQDPNILRQFLRKIEAIAQAVREAFTGKPGFEHMDKFVLGKTQAELEANLKVIRKAAAQALARYAGRNQAARDALFAQRNPGVVASPTRAQAEAASQEKRIATQKNENREGVIVGARPGEFDWSVATGTTPPPIQHPVQIGPRVEKLGPAVKKILEAKPAKQLIEDLFGITNLKVYPTLGQFKGKPEPSFALYGDGMTFEAADGLSRLLGWAFAQESTIVTQPVYAGDEDTWPAFYVSNGKKLTAKEVEAVRKEAQNLGMDYSTSIDGTAFKFFFDGSDIESYNQKVAAIAKSAGLKNIDIVGTRSTFNEAEQYTQAISSEPGSAEGTGRQVWVQDSGSGSSGLFGRAVDHLLVPYAKAVGAEGYRFSPDLFADRFGLSSQQREYIRAALRPRNGVKLSTAAIVAGRETLEPTKSDNRAKKPRSNNTDIMFALQNRAAAIGQIEPGDYSDESKKAISQAIADEVIEHISRPEGKSAIGWYDDALKRAKEIYDRVFPELKTDRNREMLFDALLGIASQGNDVHSNSVFAGRMYYLITRNENTISEAVEKLYGTFGGETRAIENNFLKFEELIDRNGYDRMRQLFNKKMTVGEWNALLRRDQTLFYQGEPLKVEGAARQKVNGWMVFGPKIGSFINNLHGDYSTLTADLWFSRTWNRILGFSFLHTPLQEADKYQAFKEALIAEHTKTTEPRSIGKDGKPKAWEHGQDIDYTDAELDAIMADPEAMLQLANELYTYYKNGFTFSHDKKDKQSGFSTKSDLRRAAKNWIEHRQESVAAPRSDNERAFQQDVVEEAQKIIKRKTGEVITIADIQAALWYHEKELFQMFGAGDKKAEPADYADAAQNFMERYDNGDLFYVEKPSPRYILGQKGDYLEGARYSPTRDNTGSGAGNEVREGGLRAPSYGTGRQGSVSVLGVHYSKEERKSLAGHYYGQGMKGAEKERLYRESATEGQRKRVHYYVDEGSGIRPESDVGDHAHATQLDNVYDWNDDPLNLWAAARQRYTDPVDRVNFVEQQIMLRGFDGVYAAKAQGNQGVVVLLGSKHTGVPVQYLGTGYRGGEPAAVSTPKPVEINDAADKVEKARALPMGQMSGADWKKMIPLVVPGADVSMLDDAKTYYKSDVVGVMRGIRYSPSRAAQAYISEIEGRLAKDPSDFVAKNLENIKRGLAGEVVRDEKGNLLAPNGRKSNLTEQQYLQVRSPAFIAWFGDWLSAHNGKNGNGIWGADNVSKVVDKNGEPLVVYHGTERGGFTSLEPTKGDKHRSPMIFAAATRETARSYAGRGDEIIMSPDPVKQVDFETLGYAFNEEEDGTYEVSDPNGYLIKAGVDLQTALRYAADDFTDNRGDYSNPAEQRGVYSLFLNIRNPNEFSFEGANWNGDAPFDKYEVFDGTGDQVYGPNGERYLSLEDAQQLAEESNGDFRDAQGIYETTNTIAEEALQYGNDGAILRQVVDDGGRGGYVEADDVFVIFDSRQAKSATQNVGTFLQSSRDLRYSPTRQAAWETTPTGKLDNFIYEAQNKLIDLKRVRDIIAESGLQIREDYDGYLAEELFHQRATYRVQLSHEQEFLPLFEEMKMRGITVAEFDKYLHARHAKERNAAMAKANPNQAELDALIAQAEQDVQQAELDLQMAQTTGKDVQQAMWALQREVAKLNSLNVTKPFSGTEEERQMLSGMSNKEAATLLAGLGNRRRSFDELGRKVDAIVEQNRQLMEAYGLETPDTVDALRQAYRHYVPLQREMDDSDLLGTGSTGTGAGYSVRGSTLKRATGSLRNVESIMAHLMAQREQIIVRGEKAMVGKSLYGMALSAPNPDFWIVIRPDMPAKELRKEMQRAGLDPALIKAMEDAPMEAYLDERTGLVRWRINPLLARDEMALTVRIGGNDRVILFNREDDRAVRLARALKNLDAIQFKGWLESVDHAVGMTTRYISSINTQYNPIFGLKNFIRDLQGAAFNLATTPLKGQETKVIGNVFHALRAIYRDERNKAVVNQAWADAWEEMQAEGGLTGYRDQYNGIEQRLKEIQNIVEPGKLRQFLKKSGAQYLFQWLSDYNTAIESGIRLSAYKAARDSGLSKKAAASLAKNLTVNFNRKGRSGAKMSGWYAFFNAAVQGNARILETAQGGYKGRAAAHYAAKFVGAGVTIGAVLAMIGIALMGDDWDDIPDFVRDRDLIIPLGKVEVEGANIKQTKNGYRYLHIPMALGFHVLPAIGRTIVEMAHYRDQPGKRLTHLLSTVVEGMNPLGQSNSLVELLAPSFMDPMIQLATNTNAFGRPIAKQNFSEKDPTPAPDRAFRSASSVGRVISKGIDRATGGDGVDPGLAQVTPDQVDFIFGQLTGGVGRESLKLYQWLESQVTGKKISESRVPIAGMFYGETRSEQATTGKFYDLERRINIAENQLKARNSPEARQEFLKSSPEARMVSRMKASVAQLNRLSKLRKRAEQRGDNAEVERLDNEANQVRVGFLESYQAVRMQ